MSNRKKINPSMIGFFGKCKNGHYEYDDRGVVRSGNSHIVINNVGVGPCPRCGEMLMLPDGEHETRDDSQE